MEPRVRHLKAPGASAREGKERERSSGQAFGERVLAIPARDCGRTLGLRRVPVAELAITWVTETTPHAFTLLIAINCMKVSQSILLINLRLFKLFLLKI